MKSLRSHRFLALLLLFTYIFSLSACTNQPKNKTVTLKLEPAYVFDLGGSLEALTFTLTEDEVAYIKELLSRESHAKAEPPSTEGIHFCVGDEDWLYFPEQAAVKNAHSGNWITFTEEENLRMADIYQKYLKQCQKTPLASYIDSTNLDKVVEDASFPIGNQAENASIVPHGTITSGMVLQRRCVNCLTGTTEDSKIAAVWNGKTYTGTVTDGNFAIYLPPAEAGGPYTLTLYSENSKKTLMNIYVGEVFLLAGQSNMQFTVDKAENGTGKIYETPGDRIVRNFMVPQGTASEPQQNTSASWVGTKSGSAIGYLFGLDLYETLDVPIGLVRSATGGTSLAYWLPKEAYDELSAEQYIYEESGKPASAGYNAMIAPLLNMRFRGVIWYQGEANSAFPETYATELECLIKTYRKAFNNPNMAFTIIELPKYEANAEGWGQIRQAQQQVASTVENVCIAVNIDQGDMKDIHPADKTVIAERTAQVTLEAFFGLDYPNPPAVVKAEKIADNQVVLTLNNADGLVVQNGTNGFQYNNGGNTFRNVSDVTVNGNTITITAKEEIQVLRYGWSIAFSDESVYNDPSKQVTIYNGDGLPMDQGYWDFSE